MPARVRLPTVGAVDTLSIFGDSISRYPCWLALAGIPPLTGVSLSSPRMYGLTFGNVANMTTPSTVKPPLSTMEGVTTPPAGVPTLGLAEAAKACGVSVSTLRRRRPELAAHGAAQTANGWRIPVTALIAIGLMGRTTDAHHESRHDTPMMPSMTPVMMAPVDALTGELEALRAKLADAEQRAAVAEAVAAERERVIQTQAMALRMLEASKTPAPATTGAGTSTPPEGPATAPPSPDTTKDRPSKPVPLLRRLLSRR
jgi:hypothetical protein